MAKPSATASGFSMPILGMIIMSIFSAIVVAFSFVVIKEWPQPASVAPALSFSQGLAWGAIAGAITGLVLGFLVDETHFDE